MRLVATLIDLYSFVVLAAVVISWVTAAVHGKQEDFSPGMIRAGDLDTLSLLSDGHWGGETLPPVLNDGEVEVLSTHPSYTKRGLPVLYEADAGSPGLAWTDDGTPLFQVEEWGSRPGDIKDTRAYWIIIRGDSMEPAYRRGWRAIVSPNLTVGDSDLVCVHLKTGERLIKNAHRDRAQSGWQLVSFNPAFPPRFVRDDDINMLHKVAYVRTMK